MHKTTFQKIRHFPKRIVMNVGVQVKYNSVNMQLFAKNGAQLPPNSIADNCFTDFFLLRLWFWILPADNITSQTGYQTVSLYADCELFAGSTLSGKTLAAFSSPATENFAPIFCRHTFAKSVFIFAAAFVGLECPFHTHILLLIQYRVQLKIIHTPIIQFFSSFVKGKLLKPILYGMNDLNFLHSSCHS